MLWRTVQGTWPMGYEWMNESEKSPPIYCTNFQWAVKCFCLATACSGGFIWFSADRCRGEAFRLINCPHRVGERQEEGIGKCSHVYPPSEDPLLRAHSLSSLALFLHLNSHTHSFITDLQVITCCCSEQLQVQWLKETVASRWQVFSSTLQGLGFPAEQ